MICGEELAALEHEQWMTWAKQILETENISPERRERWEKYFVPYEQLDETTKEFDRQWVYKIQDILDKRGLEIDLW